MRYFSEDETCINVECEKCKRVLKINKKDCEEKGSGYILIKDFNCQCGEVFNFINGKGSREVKFKPVKYYKSPKQNNGIIYALIFMGFVLLMGVFMIKGCSDSAKASSEERIQRSNDEFQQQMQQDPSTWNKEQRDRYNNFMDWTQKQKEQK